VLRVCALYPTKAGSRFDGAYYVERHAPFARQLLEPHGLIELRVTIGIAALDGAPPPFSAISELVFASRAAFDAAMQACGETLFADAPNYTDIAPVLQLSELADTKA
jgi:uncharacterized protein (TIGR02118 family)